MELKKISFTDKTSYNVCNLEKKADIITKLNKKWGIYITPKKYISFNEKINTKQIQPSYKNE